MINKMPKKQTKKTDPKAAHQIHIPRGFEMPTALMDQINECSNGGFVLFYVNDKGEPQCYCQFDGGIQALGLNTFIRHYSNCIEDANSGMVQNGLFGGVDELGDDEDGE